MTGAIRRVLGKAIRRLLPGTPLSLAAALVLATLFGGLPGKGRCDQEASAPAPNWLPASDKGFNVTLRMYWPKDKAPSILDGTWKPPAVKQVP
jgi:hypothetical protein